VWLNAIQEGSLAGRRDEGLNIEAADEPAMADAMTISLDIAPYQDRPNPAFGIWTTKKSKSVFGGSPSTMTSMISTGPTDSILIRLCALRITLGKAFSAGEQRRFFLAI
jgi:hypothetical protein